METGEAAWVADSVGYLPRTIRRCRSTATPELFELDRPRKQTRRYIAYERRSARYRIGCGESVGGERSASTDPDCVFRRPIESSRRRPEPQGAEHRVDFERTGLTWAYKRWPWSRTRSVVTDLCGFRTGPPATDHVAGIVAHPGLDASCRCGSRRPA